ncbi:hypothetical protein LCGC14_0232020 [marine sediment metagenome]|uniref:Tail terminator n=1 Tax=marine sediment metagenome TaxID=412755 RepID=A0A0F9UEJ3_9ZZZZ
MANAPSKDVVDELVSAGVATYKNTSGWGLWLAREPVTPDTAISVFDAGGDSPNPKYRLNEPTVQVRIRGAKWGYKAAYTKAQAVVDALLGIGKKTINSTVYVGIWQLGDIIFIGFDDNNRPVFTTNWRVVREVSTSTYRAQA